MDQTTAAAKAEGIIGGARLDGEARPGMDQSVPDWMRQHPLRVAAQEEEIHSRPFPVLQVPLRVSFLAVLVGETGIEEERAHLADLCRRFRAAPPSPGASFFAGQVGPLFVRWERHTEFFTYAFVQSGSFDDPFQSPPIGLVPRDWLAQLTGAIAVALHVAMQSSSAPSPTRQTLDRYFDHHGLVGSQQLVEDLSIVAISYYMLGLIKYALASAQNLGLRLQAETWTGLLVPLVIGAVWIGMRHMHKRIVKR